MRCFLFKMLSKKIKAGKASLNALEYERQEEQEMLAYQQEKLANKEKTREELENEIEYLNEIVDELSGEIELLNKELTFEKLKNSSKENCAKSSNIQQLKELFTSDLPILKKYENQSSALLHEFSKNEESKTIISRHLEDFMIKGNISIGCSDCLLWPDVLDYVSMICEVEKIVADKLEKQVKEDISAFSEWNDNDETVKLTPIFNIFGLSSEIIHKLGPKVNGRNFGLNIFDLCSSYGINDWNTILDLGYIQMMWKSNNLPCSKHLKNCPVCSCLTPKDLENLMKEHNLEFDFDLLERQNINGPRFIGSTLWTKRCGENINQDAFGKVFETMKKLHKTNA